MSTPRTPPASRIYDWKRLDAIMDELTRPGIEPFVQASFMPQALSSQPEPYTPTLVKTGLPRDMVTGGAFYPPKDYRKWEAPDRSLGAP